MPDRQTRTRWRRWLAIGAGIVAMGAVIYSGWRVRNPTVGELCEEQIKRTGECVFHALPVEDAR